MLQKEVFADKDSAKFVNRCFVPVHVIDRQREDGANDFEIEKLQKMYHVTGFPTLAIVKSSGSDVAKIVGYQGKEETMKFFTKALIPRTMFGGGGVEIEWKSLDEQFDEWPESKKPLLVLFWNENGESSRYQYLSNQELVRTIEKNFLPVEVSVPISPSAARSEKAKELLKVLSVKRTPALVIVPADGSLPHFQFGDTEADDNLVFLKTFLRLSPH
jgi:thioredoxin-related protein